MNEDRRFTGGIRPVACLSAVLMLATTLWVVDGARAQRARGQVATGSVRASENYRLRAGETPGRGRDVPGLAVNPRNPNHIVELDVDYLNGECDYHTSFDGGRTWTGGHLTARQTTENPPFPGTPPGRLPCDQNFDSGGYAHVNATVAFGSAQNVYVAFSSHRGPFNRPEGGCIPVTTTCPSPPREGGAGDDSLVARSTNGGRTFEPAVVAIPGSPNPQPFRIRPQVAVEPSRVPGGPDTLYANAWECHIKLRSGEGRLGGCLSGGGDRRMFVARSDDGGSTWTPPVLVSAQGVRTGAAVADAASPDEQIREPAQPVVGPDGTVYVAWRNRDLNPGTTCPPPTLRDCIVVARSTDRGQTWSRFNTGVTISGFINNPRLAIDPGRPAGGGTLYVTYQGPTGADFDIVVQRSTDRGQTWSNTVRVNDDAPRNNQSNPWISVAPDGRLDVVWHDQRHNYPGANLGDIYYASSTDGGATFSANHRVTDRSFNRNVGLTGVGGYTWYGPVSVPIGNNKMLVAWTDSREGDFNTGIQDIYLAQLDVPPTGLAPSTTMATATAPGFSVALSRLTYMGGGESVLGRAVARPVVVNEGDVPSALAGAVLARANFAPVLLSPAAGLTPVVKADATRLEPVGAFVVGNTASLSPQVAQDLAAATGGEAVERLVGLNPPDTARLIAERMDPRTPAERGAAPPPAAFPTVVIVNPDSPDAASASALAAFYRFPILFVNQSSVPAETTAAINNLAIKNSTATNRALVIGGPTVVSDTVMSQLATTLGQAPKRLGGLTQYDTSEAVAAESRARGMPANVVYVADGARPLDGATLGAAIGRLGGLMLLSPGASTAAAQASLLRLGLSPSVHRLVSTRGVGGQDPQVTTQDPGGPEETGGDPARVGGL
ncbi:MAG TPA: cell wall-binding repeat-containing protein, partial [Acidimicrobiales bacterium]|nr:cell wall-binding repeat-containing protein [Acidimicrobiales bacterium]